MSDQFMEMGKNARLVGGPFPFSAYMQDCLFSINKSIAENYPKQAQFLTEATKVMFDIYVITDGSVKEANLKKSSGNTDLDKSLSIIIKKTKLPPFAREMQAKTDRVIFNRVLLLISPGKTKTLRGEAIQILFIQEGLETPNNNISPIIYLELRNAPFSLSMPEDLHNLPYKICTSQSDSIFQQISIDKSIKDTPCFSGTGMAIGSDDSINGWTLFNSNGKAFNYFHKARTIFKVGAG